MTQSESRPEMVYRYRSFEERTLDILLTDSVYFANPSTFNDPLDCSPTVIVDISAVQLEELLTHLISTRVQNDILNMLKTVNGISDANNTHAKKRGEEEAQKFIDDIKMHIWMEYSSTEGIEYQEHLKSSLGWNIERELVTRYVKGVCCFSTSGINPLLWSHYANNHKGICIGYSLDRTPSPNLLSVEYGGSRILNTSTIYEALINRKRSATQNLERAILLRKAKEWEYEQEWRMIGSVGQKESPLKMREIIFGLRCPATTKFLIVEAMKNSGNKLDFKEIITTRNTYELKKINMDGEDIAFYPRKAQSAEEVFGQLPIINSIKI